MRKGQSRTLSATSLSVERVSAMTGRCLVLFAICLFAAVAFGQDEPWGEELVPGSSINARHASHLCQDATGRLWATAYSASADDLLCTWDDGWKTVLFTDGSGARSFERLCEGPDGTVIAYSSYSINGKGQYWQFRGLRARCADLPDPNSRLPRCFYVDHAGKAWVTAGRMDDLFIPPQTAGPVVTLPGEGDAYELFQRFLQGAVCLPVVRDGAGRFWMAGGRSLVPESPAFLVVDPEYSEERCPRNMESPWQRRFTVAILDSSGVRFKSDWPGRSYESYEMLTEHVLIEPFDDKTMWVGFFDGLWRVDIATFLGAPEKLNERQPGQFAGADPRALTPNPQGWFPVSIFQDKQDWYLVCRAALWRFRAGKWQCLIEKRDANDYFEPMALHGSHVATERGIWLCGRSPALWFVPRDDQAPVPIDWRSNFKLGDCGSIFCMPDGRLIAGGAEVFTEAQLLDRPAAAARFDIVKPYTKLVQGADWNLYGLFKADDTDLCQWDGETWQKLPIPGADTPRKTNTGLRDVRRAIAVDDRQRVWVVQNERDCMLPCAAYDTVACTWKFYESYLDALMDQPNHRIAFIQCDEEVRQWVPAYGPENRIGLHVYEDIFYFDGKQWFHWSVKNVCGEEFVCFSRVTFEGNLFTVADFDQTWQYSDGKGWQTAEGSASPESNLRREQSLPEYCVTRHPDSSATDRFGTFWFTCNRRLYHAGYGLCLPVFEPNTVSPIVQGFQTNEALIDRRGNAFVGNKDYLLIPPESDPPMVQVAGWRVEGNRVIFSRGQPGDCGIRYIARCNDGDWKEFAEGPEFIVGPLPDGEHKITVFALDQNLQSSPVPETFKVTIKHGAETTESALKALQSADLDMRAMAARTLVAKGRECLDALRELRKTAEPDVGWWIDAAIQQIEATDK